MKRNNYLGIGISILFLCLLSNPVFGKELYFADVPPGYWAEDAIYKIYENGITSGCSQNPPMYCPEDAVTRAQMAVFLERGINGRDYDPPGATGIFDDCPVSHWAADWVEQFYNDGITSGCSTNPLMYCPDNLVTRAQMAVFLLRSMNGEDYTPPSAEGIFEDVPVNHWAADWIEQLYDEGITGGCSTNPQLYCPDEIVNRAQMAVFIVRAFGDGFAPTGSINGVVGGTIILAVVNDEIEASEDTSGRIPDVDKNGDGINESFSFTLTGIPLDSDVRIFIIEKGAIYPLYFDSNGDGAADTNALSLACETSVNLGFVDTDVEGEDGRGIPENNPIDNLCVEAEVENTDIPTSLFEPDTSGLSLSQLISRGLDALKEAWVLRADTYFKAAEALAGSSTSNDADTARFFYALTRLAALGFDTYSDGIPNNGFNALGDILDGFDSPSDDTKRSNLAAISFPDPLPDDSPTGSDLQGFLINVLPEFQGAITNLDAVSESFNKDWMEPFDGEFVESDYGDVLFFKAMFKSALASIFAQSAYNLDADIDNTVNNDKTIEQFLNDETDFLTLSAAPGNDLNSAKNTIEDGLDDFDAAIVWMDAETDFQDDDFINLGDATAEEINQARADIVDAKNSLNEPTVVNDNKDPDDGFELDMSVFFAGLDFRDPNLLPTFSENDPVGLFPDATFGETFGAGIDLNEDTDPADGNADIFKHWPF